MHVQAGEQWVVAVRSEGVLWERHGYCDIIARMSRFAKPL